MRARVTFSVLFLVVLAGCGAMGDQARSRSPTITPVPVPETGLGPDGGRLVAPGVSTAGVFDDRALASAHERSLEATGYRLVRTVRVQYADTNGSGVNGSGIGPATDPLNRIRWSVTATPGPDAYAFTKLETARRAWVVSEPYSRIDVWYRGDVVRNRFVDADRQERLWGTNLARRGGPISDPTSHEDAVDDLAAVELRAAGNASGGTVTRFRGSELTDPARLGIPPLASDPRNVSLVAEVDESGVIRNYTLTFDATFSRDGRRLRVQREHRVTDLDQATVPTPAWVPAANESVVGA
jgi:hypothetical protein